MTTAREVATEAGVSLATASRVLSGADYPVRAATRARVLEVAERLGYRPNALAQNFRRGRTSAVGISCTTLSNLTTISIIEGMSEMLDGVGRYPQIVVNRWDPIREREGLDLFLAEHSSGVVSFPSQMEQASYLRLQEAGVPVVLINRGVPGVPAPVVRHDFAGGYRRAAELLAGQGHTRIVGLLAGLVEGGGPAHSIAWSAALTRLGLEAHPEWHVPIGGSRDLRELQGQLADFFSGSERPTALFCGTVSATIVVLRLLEQLGMRVPEDVAVVGTSDHAWRPLIPDEIPTLVLDSHRLGETAARTLEDMIGNGGVTSDAEVIVGVDLDMGSKDVELEGRYEY